MGTVELVSFDDLVIDDTVNARVKGTVPSVVSEYANERKAGKSFPPGRAFRSKDGVILSRGFHRAKAYKQAGDLAFPVEIVEGDRKDAEIDALNDNIDHGLRRSNEDKRYAVERCLGRCPDWTQEQIAEHCGVTHMFVGNIIAEIAAADADASDIQTSDFETVSNSHPQTKAPKGDSKRGRSRTKVDDAARIGAALKADATKSDDLIAEQTGTKNEFVSKIRKALEKKNLIKKVAETNPHKVAEADDPKAEAKKLIAQEKEKTKEEKTATKIVLPPQLDAWGIPIQPHAVEAFAAVPKFKELIAAISHAAKLFNEVAGSEGGKFLTLPDASSYRRGKKLDNGEYADRFVHEGLESALQTVKRCIPTYTVCPYQYADAGHPAECPCCRGINWTPVLTNSISPVCIERAKSAHGVKEVASV